MAVADWDAVSSISREKILPGVMDQIYVDMPILKRLFGNAERLDGGTEIQQPIKYAISTQGGPYAGLGGLDTGYEKTRTRAKWQWTQYHRPIVLSNIDIAKNGGTEKVVDLVGQEMKEAEGDLKDLLGTHLYGDGTGSGGLEFLGLVAAIDDGTNVDNYGDIPRTTNTWWQSDYNGAGGALSLATMRTSWDAAKSGSDVPTVIATTEAMFTKYEALLQANPRWEVQQMAMKMGSTNAELVFRGAPVIGDEKCTAGYMYMINEKYLKIFTLAHPKFPTRPDGFAMTDMREPVDQDGTVGFLLNYFQMVNLQSRRHAVIRGLS